MIALGTRMIKPLFKSSLYGKTAIFSLWIIFEAKSFLGFSKQFVCLITHEWNTRKLHPRSIKAKAILSLLQDITMFHPVINVHQAPVHYNLF